ncbi:MAG TPA: hypothetical protein VH144_01730 [Candidatus Saccharimonadales bacterium]|nr:hypothetical protein [Candidatus Saccharimonadales bacterium]
MLTSYPVASRHEHEMEQGRSVVNFEFYTTERRLDAVKIATHIFVEATTIEPTGVVPERCRKQTFAGHLQIDDDMCEVELWVYPGYPQRTRLVVFSRSPMTAAA